MLEWTLFILYCTPSDCSVTTTAMHRGGTSHAHAKHTCERLHNSPGIHIARTYHNKCALPHKTPPARVIFPVPLHVFNAESLPNKNRGRSDHSYDISCFLFEIDPYYARSCWTNLYLHTPNTRRTFTLLFFLFIML